MEATAEGLGEMLKGVAIRPPRLEDAGLEECALPPDAIREAFARAACSLKSRLASGADDDEEGPGCVHDPGPSNGDAADALLGGTPVRPSCGGAAEKEGATRGSEDRVIVVGGDEEETVPDRLVVLGGEEGGKKSCVVDGEEGPKGVVEWEKRKEKGDGGEEEDKPILVEYWSKASSDRRNLE